MGANPTQGTGVLIFLVAFVIVAVGMAAGGSVLAFLIGAVVLAAACAVLMRCKPWEHQED